MSTYSTLRDANRARQAEWDPSGFTANADWRMNELAGEVGEACNVLKKLWREKLGVPGTRATREQLADELADILICLDLVVMDLAPNFEITGRYKPRDVDTWPAFGCRFVQSVAVLAQYRSDLRGTEMPVYEALVSDVRHCASVFGIDIDAAVQMKFNSTSERVGLTTRLDFRL